MTTMPVGAADQNTVTSETPTIIDFDAAAPIAQVSPARRWWLIGATVGGSIALSTVATAMATVIARRLSQPRRRVGGLRSWRYGVRRIRAPRGGAVWVAYTYRLPHMRIHLPQSALSTAVRGRWTPERDTERERSARVFDTNGLRMAARRRARKRLPGARPAWRLHRL